jgi:hypothetical protein
MDAFADRAEALKKEASLADGSTETREDATCRVEKYLAGRMMSRPVSARRAQHGWIVTLTPQEGDLPGALPVYFAPYDSGSLYQFPGDAAAGDLESAEPHREEADKRNPLNQMWPVG